MPPNQTILGDSFFEFEYTNIIQDYFSLLLSCRNMTLRSPNATVSECDTPIHQYYVSERDTRSPNTTCRNVTPDPLLLRVGT